jgi:dolichol-phosphate mannosyltransferase
LTLTEGEAPAPDVTVVVATLNEAGNIGRFWERLESALGPRGHDVVFIDDHSTDGTAELLRALVSRHPHVHLLERPGRGGTASAQYEGWRRAAGRWVVVMDGDLQHRPEEVPRLLLPLERGEVDLVVGSRYVPGGSAPERPWGRSLISYGGDRVIRLLLPETRWRTDPMSGFFAFRRELLEGPALSPRGMKFLFYLLVRARRERTRDVPIVFETRTTGTSKLVGRGMLRALFSSAWGARRSRPSRSP